MMRQHRTHLIELQLLDKDEKKRDENIKEKNTRNVERIREKLECSAKANLRRRRKRKRTNRKEGNAGKSRREETSRRTRRRKGKKPPNSKNLFGEKQHQFCTARYLSTGACRTNWRSRQNMKRHCSMRCQFEHRFILAALKKLIKKKRNTNKHKARPGLREEKTKF